MDIDFIPTKIYVCATELTEAKKNAQLVVYYRSDPSTYRKQVTPIKECNFADKILTISINTHRSYVGAIKKWIAIG